MFGTEVAESWKWAEAKNPLNMTLYPAVRAQITLNQFSNDGTLLDTIANYSNGLSSDVTNWYMMVDGQDDIYKVTYTDSNYAISLDSFYKLADGTYNVTFIKLEYDLTDTNNSDNSIIINNYNNYLDYIENGNNKTIQITKGRYSNRFELFLAIKAALNIASVSGVVYDVFSIQGTNLFKLSALGYGSVVTSFGLRFGQERTDSGGNQLNKELGFLQKDYTGALEYTPEYIPNGILRVTKPINMYRESAIYNIAAKDSNKIFLTDSLTFHNEFPLSRITAGVPSRFCIVEQTNKGGMTIKFNSYPDEMIKAELSYIPVQQSLLDATYIYPNLPTPYTKFLVYGASYYLLMEKSDSKAEQYLAMAQAELKAMVNDNRKSLSLGGNNYGRLIPRRNIGKYYGRGY